MALVVLVPLVALFALVPVLIVAAVQAIDHHLSCVVSTIGEYDPPVARTANAR